MKKIKAKKTNVSKRKKLKKIRKVFESRTKKYTKRDQESFLLLAAGVAHEFNNLLGAAHGHAQWALENNDIESMRSALQSVELVCERSAQLTRALQNFSQPHEEAFKPFDLSDLVKEALRILDLEILESKVKVYLHLKKAVAEVIPEKILEVFINLIKNAIEALQEMPELNRKIKIEIREIKKNWEISFSDNGPGIDKLYQKLVFQPFWTSKGVLQGARAKTSSMSAKAAGSGLGLFLVKKILHEHGGDILLKSSPKGSTFKLKLSH